MCRTVCSQLVPCALHFFAINAAVAIGVNLIKTPGRTEILVAREDAVAVRVHSIKPLHDGRVPDGAALAALIARKAIARTDSPALPRAVSWTLFHLIMPVRSFTSVASTRCLWTRCRVRIARALSAPRFIAPSIRRRWRHITGRRPADAAPAFRSARTAQRRSGAVRTAPRPVVALHVGSRAIRPPFTQGIIDGLPNGIAYRAVMFTQCLIHGIADDASNHLTRRAEFSIRSTAGFECTAPRPAPNLVGCGLELCTVNHAVLVRVDSIKDHPRSRDRSFAISVAWSIGPIRAGLSTPRRLLAG